MQPRRAVSGLYFNSDIKISVETVTQSSDVSRACLSRFSRAHYAISACHALSICDVSIATDVYDGCDSMRSLHIWIFLLKNSLPGRAMSFHALYSMRAQNCYDHALYFHENLSFYAQDLSVCYSTLTCGGIHRFVVWYFWVHFFATTSVLLCEGGLIVDLVLLFLQQLNKGRFASRRSLNEVIT